MLFHQTVKNCGTTPDILILSAVDALRWRKVNDGGIPARYEHASFALGSDLFLFAGAQTTGPLNDIWKYISCTCMEIYM